MSDLVIRPEQKLVETWEVTYTRFPWSSLKERHTTARISIPHPTLVGSSGRGRTVDEARIDALVGLAAGYVSIEDEEESLISDETLDILAKTVRREQSRRRMVRIAAEGTGCT